jgi:hypothetical protein
MSNALIKAQQFEIVSLLYISGSSFGLLSPLLDILSAHNVFASLGSSLYSSYLLIFSHLLIGSFYAIRKIGILISVFCLFWVR